MQDHRVTLFGELLLRLDVPDYQRMVQASSLDVSYTGGEANVAVALAQWGVETDIVSAVPENAIGDGCLNHLRRYGVRTEHVARTGERLGILYVEKGAGQRGTQVTYDREGTSFRQLSPAEVNWQKILTKSSWLHFTGTALVGPESRTTLIAGLRHAKEKNIPVSFDASYRSKLWSVADAKAAFCEVIEYVDLFIGSDLDAQTFFDINKSGDEAIRALHRQYGLRWIAFSERCQDDEGRAFYSGKFFDGENVFTSAEHQTSDVDRIGTGDAFAAGLIDSILKKKSAQETVNFATAAAVLKHTIPGDFALLKRSEIENYLQGTATGKISR